MVDAWMRRGFGDGEMVTHKDLGIWKEGMELVEAIYRILVDSPIGRNLD
jgi:hypothetical protein